MKEKHRPDSNFKTHAAMAVILAYALSISERFWALLRENQLGAAIERDRTLRPAIDPLVDASGFAGREES